jgi:uncharacterized protein (DUF433 family)
MTVKRQNFATGAPLVQNDDGTVRVNGSRVTLDTLVAAFQREDTREEILESFPSLSAAQINDVMDWYLTHQTETQEYVGERATDGERLRQQIESRPEYAELREKLQRHREQLIKT